MKLHNLIMKADSDKFTELLARKGDLEALQYAYEMFPQDRFNKFLAHFIKTGKNPELAKMFRPKQSELLPDLIDHRLRY